MTSGGKRNILFSKANRVRGSVRSNMRFYQKLTELRKAAGLSQEELAKKSGVSRQTVFKWEAGLVSPSMENILTLCRIFGVSADELIGNEACPAKSGPEAEQLSSEKTAAQCVCQSPAPSVHRKFRYEYKSKRTLFNLPLVHICIGAGKCRAKGIIAIGNIACGLFSLGIVSVGAVSFGAVALGLIAVAALAVGGFALGAIAVGMMAVGSIAVGLFAIGALAVGMYSVGAAAIGTRIAATVAVTGYAKAPIVVSNGVPNGSWTTLVTDFEGLLAANAELFPSTPWLILRILSSVL